MPTKAEKAIAIIKNQCSLLSKMKVPFIFGAKPALKIISFGTKHSKELFTSKQEEFDDSFKEDILYLCIPAHVDDSTNIVEDNQAYEKMKTPLSLANAGEVKKYARHIILEDFKKRNPKSKEYQIKYGSADWEASFWPTDLMAWSSLSENFSNIKKKDVPGNNSINDILKKAISNALEAKELDPETFFDTKAFR